jgi:lysophospholipase L1-like esterase
MNGSIRRIVVGSFEALRTTWLVIGVTIALFIVLEVAMRIVQAPRADDDAPPRVMLAGDPRAEPWFADYNRDYNATRGQRWRSYVYFGRNPSYRGRYISIDSAGHRVTPQPTTADAPAARVFLFGGSTMWGTSQRGDHTLAAEVARRLQPLAGPGRRIEVVNFGETGYVNTQELLQLMLALRAGNVPDVVLFYDGLNDVFATVQYGTPGVPQNESKRADEFAMGRLLDPGSYGQGTRRDVSRLAMLSGQALQQLAITRWVKGLKSAPAPVYPPADSAAHATARVYAENVRLVEALAARYGFTPIYVWQPNLHASEKQLDPFEQRLRRRIAADAFHRRIQEVHRVIPPIVDSAMATVVPRDRFVQAADLFHGDTLPVYTDWLGHTNEVSVPRIVDTFWPALQAATQKAVASHKTVASRPAVSSAPALAAAHN